MARHAAGHFCPARRMHPTHLANPTCAHSCMLAALGLTRRLPSRSRRRGSRCPRFPYEKYRLANGLEVILAQDRSLPIVAVNLWYHVGAANEEPGRTGFAHLFEHMMFTGTQTHPARASRGTARRGGRFRFQCVDVVRSHELFRYRSVEPARARAVDACGPDGLPARLARPDGADQPAGRRAQRAPPDDREPAVRHRRRGDVFTRCFRRAIRIAPTIIGSHVDIQAAQLADVRDFFKRYYRPEQRHAGHLRRLRHGDRQTAGAEAVRLVQARGRSAAAGGQDAAARRPSNASPSPTRSSSSASTSRG